MKQRCFMTCTIGYPWLQDSRGNPRTNHWRQMQPPKTWDHSNRLCAWVCSILLLTCCHFQRAQPAPWIPTLPLHVGRYSHTATLLSDGRALIAGGVANNGGTTN